MEQTSLNNLVNNVNESTKTDNSIKENTISILMTANKILKKFKGKEEYTLIKDEYIQVENTIREALKNDNQITKEELMNLKLELMDLKDYKLDNIDSIIQLFDSKDFRNKSIEDYTLEESTVALQYLNTNYNKIENKGFIIGINTIASLDNKTEINNFQELLINKILGEGNKGYNPDYIQGYDNKKGNYLIEISDFLDNIKNIPANENNSLALANLLLYSSQGGHKINKSELLIIFGKETLIKLAKIWDKEDDNENKQIAKKILIENGLSDIVKEISDFGQFFEKVLEGNTNSPFKDYKNINRSIMDNLSNAETEKAKDYLIKNTNVAKKLNDNAGVCITNKTNSTKILETAAIIEFEQRLDNQLKKVLKGLKTKDGKDALDLVKKQIKSGNFCEFNFINFIKENIVQKDEKGKDIEINDENAAQILKDYRKFKEEKLILEKEHLENTNKELSKEDQEKLDELNLQLEKINKRKLIPAELAIKIANKSESIQDYNKLLDVEVKKIEIEKIKKINDIDSKNILDNSYSIKNIPEQNGENNSLIINGKEISGITGKEYNSIIEINEKGEKIIKNQEALKNLVDFKEKMKVLNLDFVWKYRNELTTEAKKHPEYSSLNNTDKDLLNPKELHKLLNFVLDLIGEKGDTSSISGTYAKIIQINGGGEFNNKKDTITGLSNIGQKFYKYGYIGRNSFDTNNQSNIINYKNILKDKKTS